MDLKYIFALFVSFMIPELNVCLTCFSCSGVADLNSCDATVTCDQGQSCSLEMDVSGQTTSYTLGCKNSQICDTHPGLIGRDLSCHECCSTDNCNKHICKPSAQCREDEMCVDLDNTGGITGSLAGVSIHSAVTTLMNEVPCSRQAVLKVHFLKDDRLEPCQPDSTFDITLPPQRMLNIQMHFSDGTRSGWMFNVADSETNNGWGGDGSTQSHDSEVQGVTSSIAVYGDDQCPDGSIRHVRSYANSLNHSVSMANLWIRNNYLKITNDHGMLHSECHKCLFALNGQPDDEGQENEDIYIGANRVVDGAYRAGVGLCSIKLRWVNH